MSDIEKVIDYLVTTGHGSKAAIIKYEIERLENDLLAMTTDRDAAVVNQDILTEQLAEAKAEIEILRQYGNKDCTAMADEALAKQEDE